MSEKKVVIQHRARCTKVKFNDYVSLIRKTKEKLKISTDFHLEYEENGKWFKITDDDDVEHLSDESNLRVVVEIWNHIACDKNNATNMDKMDEQTEPMKFEKQPKFKNESGLLQEEFQILEYEQNSCVKQKLYFHFFEGQKPFQFYYTNRRISCRKKCEFVIEPQKISQTPFKWYKDSYYKNAPIQIFGLKGTGKTTLGKMLSTEALNTVKPRYIFYFNCSNLDLNKETTLLEFLEENIYNNSQEKTLDNETLNKLEHSDEVIIVIDDAMNISCNSADACLRVPVSRNEYHRLSTHSSEIFEDNSSSCGLKQINLTNTGHNHLSKILNSEIMSKSKKIITCLLNAPLHSDLRSPIFSDDEKRHNILLVGLNRKNQLEIFKSIGEKNQQKVEKYFQNHPGLLDFCYMPDICFLTGHCINELLSSSTSQTFFPNNLTDIFVFLLDKLVSDSSSFDFYLLTEICELAWSGIKNYEAEFELSNLSKTSLNSQSMKNLSANINKSTLHLFKFLIPSKTFHFTISLSQEFFAAIHLIFMMPFDEFKMLISTEYKVQIFNLYNYQNKYITRFMFGLCNDVTHKHLLNINSSFLLSTDKISFLYNIVCHKNSQIKILDNTILQHLAWVHELHIDSYTQKLVSRFSNEIKVDCQFYQENTSAFFYVLQARYKPVTITALSNKNFFDDSWKWFFTLSRSVSIKMLSLDLSRNKLGDKEAAIFSQFVHSSKQLILKGCDITMSGVETISHKINGLDEPMLSLDLSSNIKFGDEGAELLSQCVHNIKQLKLELCAITKPGVEAISKKISDLDKPMLLLDLSWSKFGDEGADILSNCIHNIKQLILQHCDITKPGLEAISNKICCLDEPMLLLDLSWNKFGDEGADILSNCIHNIKQLILQHCDITKPGLEAISNKICCLDEPMEHLKLEGNKVGNGGFFAISTCDHNIVKLAIGDLYDLELTMKGIKTVLSALEKKSTALLELKIDCEDSIRKQAKKEAQKYQWNIWIGDTQVSFKVETVKISVETDCDKHVEPETSLRDYLLDEAERISEKDLPSYLEKSILFFDSPKCFTLDTGPSVTANEGDKSSETTKSPIAMSDLFKVAHNILSQSDDTNYNRNNLVWLVGDSGSGKTTLIKSLLHHCCRNKSLYGYEFVFYLNCSHIDLNVERNLLQHLTMSIPYAWITDNTICKEVLKLLLNRKTCFILDGVNCMSIQYENKCMTSEPMSAGYFIQQIVLGKIFPNAFKLISFQPLEINRNNLLLEIKPRLKLVFIAQIKKKELKNICQNICDENHSVSFSFKSFYLFIASLRASFMKNMGFIIGLNAQRLNNLSSNRHEQVFAYIQAYFHLKTYCFVLANSVGVVFRINELVETKKEFLHPLICFPLTCVFLPSIVRVILNNDFYHDAFDLSDIIKEAWTLLNNKTNFDMKNLSNNSLQILNNLMHINLANTMFSRNSLLFPKIIFDLLIAMYLLLFDKFNICELEEIIEETTFHQKFRLLFGLCNKSMETYIEKLFPFEFDLNEKTEILQELLEKRIVLNVSDYNYFSRLLYLCSLVFEMQDNKFADYVADILPFRICMSSLISDDNLGGFVYVMSKRKKRLFLFVNTDLYSEKDENFMQAQSIIKSSTKFVHFVSDF